MGLDVDILSTGGGGVSQTQLDSALAEKVAKAGDDMSGTLGIDTADSNPQMELDYASSGTPTSVIYDGYGFQIRLPSGEYVEISPDAFVVGGVPFALPDLNIAFRGNLIEEDLAGSSYNLDVTNPPGIIIVDQDSTDINVGSFSKHSTPYDHLDVLIVVQVDSGTFSYARIHPYTANGSGSALTAHTRINTKGTSSSSGIWNLGTDGPDGAYFSLAANSVYRLTSSRLKDSTAPGHQGTLNIFKIADIV